MGRSWGWAGLAMGAAITAPAPAAALDGIKVGVAAHNLCVTSCKNADKEAGPVVDVQLNFKSPGVLRIVGAPRPYLHVAPNISGETSFASAGLEWRWEVVDGWTISPSLGYAVHNGEISNPFPNGTPESTAYAQDHVLYGSRDLFRTSIGVGREFGERWGVEAYYQHYSHGQILGEGRNQGADQAGVRVGYRFSS